MALVLIDAEGERAFCAGGDIAEIYARGRQGDFGFARRFWAEEYRMNARIARYPKPYVALMQGFVMGGGVGVAGARQPPGGGREHADRHARMRHRAGARRRRHACCWRGRPGGSASTSG